MERHANEDSKCLATCNDRKVFSRRMNYNTVKIRSREQQDIRNCTSGNETTQIRKRKREEKSIFMTIVFTASRRAMKRGGRREGKEREGEGNREREKEKAEQGSERKSCNEEKKKWRRCRVIKRRK